MIIGTGRFFLRSFQSAQTDGEMKIDENVPASKPTMIGNANTRIDGTPMIATMAMVIRVVIDVLSERTNVSLID